MKRIKTKFTARSKQNGIVFYSNAIPTLAVKSILLNNNQIYSTIYPKIVSDVEDCLEAFQENDKRKSQQKNVLLTISILLLLISLLSQNFFLTCAVFFFVATVLKNLLDILIFTYQIKCKEKSLGRFHAAEHMAINAYSTLNRVPTLEEIKKFSRFSSNCGSCNKLRNIIIYSICSLDIAFVALYSFFLCAVLFFLTFLVVRFLSNNGFLNFLQILVTNKPNKLELEVAIQGIEVLDEIETNSSKFITEYCDLF